MTTAGCWEVIVACNDTQTEMSICNDNVLTNILTQFNGSKAVRKGTGLPSQNDAGAATNDTPPMTLRNDRGNIFNHAQA